MEMKGRELPLNTFHERTRFSKKHVLITPFFTQVKSNFIYNPSPYDKQAINRDTMYVKHFGPGVHKPAMNKN